MIETLKVIVFQTFTAQNEIFLQYREGIQSGSIRSVILEASLAFNFYFNSRIWKRKNRK